MKQFCQTKIKKLSLVTASMIHSNSSEKRNEEPGSKPQPDSVDLLKVVQAKKSIWRMPWHWEPKKDVTSCDKLR